MVRRGVAGQSLRSAATLSAFVLWPPDFVVRLRHVGSVAHWLPIVFAL